MNRDRRRSSRRGLVAGSAAALAVGALPRAAPTLALQTDRELLDLLLVLEQTQVVHYTAIRDAFTEQAFADAGLPDGTRGLLDAILAAEEVHLALLTRPDGSPSPGPIVPAPTDLGQALRDVTELENLAVAAYALVVPETERQRLIPDLIGIHSVEGRHAAWLASILGLAPVPVSIDPMLSLEEVSNRLVALASGSSATGTPTVAAEHASLVTAIARELGVSPQALTSVVVTPRVWSDASLGCPRPGGVYAEVLTPGFLIEFEISGEQYEFHADERGNVVRCP